MVSKQVSNGHRLLVKGALAASLVIFGSILVDLGVAGNNRVLPPPVSPPAGHVSTLATSKIPYKLTASVRASNPVTLRIPAIGLRTRLITLGLKSDGTVQVPTSSAQAGWYKFGPTPGQLGSSVILGHVDSYRGPAIFYQLRTLVPGNVLVVTLADRMTATFRVTAVSTYPKNHFPAQVVYGTRNYSALQLVTCGGAFEPRTGSYLSNVVVFSRLVSLVHSK